MKGEKGKSKQEERRNDKKKDENRNDEIGTIEGRGSKKKSEQEQE